MGASYGFSVLVSRKRETGYILIPGLRTSRIAPIINIGMSAPDWIKFLISYIHRERVDLSNPTNLNKLIYDRDRGLFFQGLKWRIQDPSDAAGYGIGINTLKKIGILSTINPEKNIKKISIKLVLPIKRKIQELFLQIFSPDTISNISLDKIFNQLDEAARLPEPKRTYELVSILVDVIGESLENKPISEQNEIAGTINQFIRILEMMGVKSWREISKDSPISLLCLQPPGEISPHLSPLDIAEVLHELIDTEGSPIVMSFLVSDILGANKTSSPEEILWEANYRLPTDRRIEQHVKKFYDRISELIISKGFSTKISKSDFLTLCSASEIRKEAIWWEYNLTLGKLEELMRDFVGPYRYQTPWSGKFKKELLRLTLKKGWNRKASQILKKTEKLANNVVSKEIYTFVIGDDILLSWFREIQPILNSNIAVHLKLRKLWEYSSKFSNIENDPVARFDSTTDTISLLKDPREDNPYIQRNIVYDWMQDFSRIW